MTADCVYFIAGLPGLIFGASPPFSFSDYLAKADSFILPADKDILRNLSRGGEYICEDNLPEALKRWQIFDTALRNELAVLRAGPRRGEPAKYLRPQKEKDYDLERLAVSAYKNSSILEAERFLDEERWRFLEGLAFGHYFDLDFLVIYGLKLLILERWERIIRADKVKIVEEILGRDSLA